MRTEHYLEQLSKFRDDGDDFDQIKAILENKNELWNFQGLIAVRPWGPKTDWHPASNFTFPKADEAISGAKWTANNIGIDTYLSPMEILLPAGTYKYRITEKTTS